MYENNSVVVSVIGNFVFTATGLCSISNTTAKTEATFFRSSKPACISKSQRPAPRIYRDYNTYER